MFVSSGQHLRHIGHGIVSHAANKWSPSVYSVLISESHSGHAVEIDGVPMYIHREEVPIERLLTLHSDKKILSFEEWRTPFSEWGYELDFGVYHAFVLLAVEEDLCICTEKSRFQVEVMLGPSKVIHTYAREWCTKEPERRRSSVHGKHRKISAQHDVTIGMLCDFIVGPFAQNCKPYNVIFANCQHYATELYAFLQDPTISTKDETDRARVKAAVSEDGRHLQYACKALRGDPELVSIAWKQVGSIWILLSCTSLIEDVGFAACVVAQNGFNLSLFEDVWNADIHVVLVAVQQNGLALQYVAEGLRADRRVALSAIRQNGFALQYVDEAIRADFELVNSAWKQLGSIEALASCESLRDDSRFATTVVKQDGLALRCFKDAFGDDIDVVLAAVQQTGLALQHVGGTLRGDRSVVLTAVHQNGRALQHAIDKLHGDEVVVLAAVRQNGLALKYAAETLRGSRDVVRAAVQQDGLALQYADKLLRRDTRIVLLAGRQNESALKYAVSS